MQRNMPILPQPPALNPLKDAAGLSAVDYTADFDGLYKRIDNLVKIFKTRKGPGQLINIYLA